MSTYNPDNSLDRMEPREKPDVELMLREVRDAVNGANALGVFQKMQICHHTRNCWWQGQQDDGRKPAPKKGSKDNLYHWEGAPETRWHKADEIVLERAGTREMVLHRGSITVAPQLDALDDDSADAKAEEMQTVLDHFAKRSKRAMNYAWKLFSTCVEEFGYGVLASEWEREMTNEIRRITTDEFIGFITGDVTRSMVGENGNVQQLTPEQLQMIQAQAQMGYAMATMDTTEGRDLGVQLLQTMDATISTSEARIALKQLADSGTAEYFVPADGDGKLMPMALIPWVNYIHPAALAGGGKTDWDCIPEWVSGPTLQSANRGYRKDWVKRVLDHPNKTLPELLSVSLENVYGWVLNGAGIGLHIDQNYIDQSSPVYLILHVRRRAVDKSGRITVFKTVIHAMVSDDYGMHEGTGLSEIPVLIDTAEPVNHAMLSRGVGEIVVAGQNQVIDLMDSEGARSQLGSNPPLKRGVADHVPVRPGMQMFVRTAGVRDATDFMTTPRVDEGSLKLIEIAERFIDQRYFRAATTDPDTRQQQKELLAHAAMQSLEDFWKMQFLVIQTNLKTFRGQPIDLTGDTHIEVEFNVAGLSHQTADDWMKTLTDLMAIDPGVIDRSAAVKDIIRMRNPVMAKRLVMSDESAAEKIRADQQLRISKIVNGWKPTQADYPQRAVNPQLRLTEMQQWMQDPYNQQRLQMHPDSAEIMQQEMKYLQDQYVQYQQNPLTGKTLVSPKTPQEIGA